MLHRDPHLSMTAAYTGPSPGGALALPSLLGVAVDVPRRAAAMFTVSYGLSEGAALLAGRLRDISGVAALAFIPFVLASLAVTVLGATLRLAAARRA